MMNVNCTIPPRKLSFIAWHIAAGLFLYAITPGLLSGQNTGSNIIRITSRNISPTPSNSYSAFYIKKRGLEMRSGNVLISNQDKEFDYYSDNNGATWKKKPMTPDYRSGLPYGFRRDPVVSVLDKNTKRIITFINALDVKDLDPNIIEPPIGEEAYYLRYRVSADGGNSWSYDEPVIQEGDFTLHQPFPDVTIGKNSIYIGDVGSIPLVTRKGKILLPVQNAPLGDDGKLWNPYKTTTYTDVAVLIGTWKKNGKLSWTMSGRVKGDPARSTRGMIEPTLLERADGQLMMVMRGSNDRLPDQPAYKWVSVSEDEGKTWSVPEPFTYEDGTHFFSPSAMSTLFKHSSGRCFWIGNISEENARGNSPRYPLVIGEVNTDNFSLRRSTVLTIDSLTEEDKDRGRLDISHFTVMEDRKTREIVITYPRSYHSYQSREWATVRLAVK